MLTEEERFGQEERDRDLQTAQAEIRTIATASATPGHRRNLEGVTRSSTVDWTRIVSVWDSVGLIAAMSARSSPTLGYRRDGSFDKAFPTIASSSFSFPGVPATAIGFSFRMEKMIACGCSDPKGARPVSISK